MNDFQFSPASEDDPKAPDVGPTTVGCFVCGKGIPGITDGKSEILEILRITRHEAEILMVSWFERYRGTYELCEIYHRSGSTEWRELAYSEYRLNLLSKYIGQECRDWISAEIVRRDVELIERQAEEDLKNEVSDDSYGSFTGSDPASPDSERDSDLG